MGLMAVPKDKYLKYYSYVLKLQKKVGELTNPDDGGAGAHQEDAGEALP